MAMLLGCSTEPPAEQLVHGTIGQSIVVFADGGRVAVANPDNGSVSVVDATSLEDVGSIDVGGHPRQLLRIGGERALVSDGERSLVVVDLKEARVVERREICAGPYGLARSPDEAWVAVACEFEGSVVRLRLADMSVETVAADLESPRVVVVLDDAVLVVEHTGGMVRKISLGGAPFERSLVPPANVTGYRPPLSAMSASLGTALAVLSDRVYVAHELVDNASASAPELVAANYGSSLDGSPKVNPAVTTLRSDLSFVGAPPTYAMFDGGTKVYSGPSAIVPFGKQLLVAHISTNNVAVLDPSASTHDARAIGTFRVGRAPAGIAIDPSGKYAYVDNWFDRSVSKIDLEQAYRANAPKFEPVLTRLRKLPERYSRAALEGRKVFYDATNIHATPSGIIACATCHPSGGDDGLVWLLHTEKIPLKRRRTPHLANAHSETAPFHWNGEFSTMEELSLGTFRDLMGGDALLIEADTIRAYVDEMVESPPAPRSDLASTERGRALFERADVGCATCHSGPLFTDRKSHAVLDPMSLHPDEQVPAIDTPGLRGVFMRRNLFHDGRAHDLTEMLTRSDARGHGDVSMLSEGERADLVRYLRAL